LRHAYSTMRRQHPIQLSKSPGSTRHSHSVGKLPPRLRDDRRNSRDHCTPQPQTQAISEWVARATCPFRRATCPAERPPRQNRRGASSPRQLYRAWAVSLPLPHTLVAFASHRASTTPCARTLPHDLDVDGAQVKHACGALLADGCAMRERVKTNGNMGSCATPLRRTTRIGDLWQNP
jgi:hypothetical protein